MTQPPHILLLGGSYEAQLLAEALTARNAAYTMWVAEAPRGPALLPQVPMLRRFSDVETMRDEISRGGFTAVLDASHAFDHATITQSFQASHQLELPYLRVERPAWDLSGNPHWRAAASVAEANAMISKGARVFCATGWDSLPDYAGFRGEVLMLRQARRHTRAVPYPFVELIFGDPPFEAPSEEALFLELGVDLLICRNLGGEGSRPKLDAAAALGIDVILIDRPAVPEGLPVVGQTAAALDWVTAL
ncbi:precorrin-6A/cobalt-precorrin-6A reductase [Sulfitobacter sp.]|uniref:precorrin-6A/cobalt-precorrin-6A reductase n=1 Tax=Sulfitobacter sp. TaxID=1903071 RepID=UPI003EF9C69A